MVAETNEDIIITGFNISCKCYHGTILLSISRIGLHPLDGLSKYRMSLGEMKSLWRVILRVTNAIMVLRYTVKGLKVSGVGGGRIFV